MSVHLYGMHVEGQMGLKSTSNRAGQCTECVPYRPIPSLAAAAAAFRDAALAGDTGGRHLHQNDLLIGWSVQVGSR